jgi:hypothetical protein
VGARLCVPDSVRRIVELFAPVTLPEIPFVGFVIRSVVLRARIVCPLPIERTATRAASRFLELPSNRVIPVLREPKRVALPYYASGKDGPRDSMT